MLYLEELSALRTERSYLLGLIDRIRAALDTDEGGDALVSVARDACQAEQELAALERAHAKE